MIYISTGGYSNLPFFETVEQLSKSGINSFELSGGTHVTDVELKLKNMAMSNSIVLHNYFPPPKKPFVFNLGSLDKSIVKESMRHAKLAIDLSSLVGSKYYSFHAGYLIDPKVDELGNKIKNRQINDRELSKAKFIHRVNELSDYAKLKNIQILIENNVLSKSNYEAFNNNPLLMVDYEETEEIISKTNHNVSLLIDVAHLKVSANTLSFSAENYISDFIEITSAYHLSDNIGFEDTNDPISGDSWFWPYITPKLDYYSLEIYNANAEILLQQLELTKEHIDAS